MTKRASLLMAAIILVVGLMVASPPVRAQVKPYMLIIFDTSGSMAWTVGAAATNGDGSNDPWGTRWCCPGDDMNGNGAADDSRIYMVKEAMRLMVASTGDLTFGLMKFPQRFTVGSTQVATYYVDNQNASGTDLLRYNGNSYCTTTDPDETLCVPFSPESSAGVYTWMNHSEYMNPAGTVIPGEFELRAVGTTPLAFTVGYAEDYYEGAGLFTAHDPVGSDPYRGCRPYYTIVLSDGENSLFCGGDPVTEVRNLHDITPGGEPCSTEWDCPGIHPVTTANPWGGRCVGGQCTYRVKSYVIGFAFSTPSTTLNNMADYGDDNILNVSASAYNASSTLELAGALSDIIADSVLVELCNGVDDDCDGLIDEGFTKYCDLHDVLGLGATSSLIRCSDPGETICDGLDDNCNGLTDDNPAWTLYCDVHDVLGLGATSVKERCTDPGETVCDGVDDNCNGFTDESGVCGCLPMAEVCNNADDDCDTIIDNGVTRSCGTDVGPCVSGTQTCTAGVWGACVGETPPGVETCNNIDDDCNGVIDGYTDQCEMSPGVADTGVCEWGIHACIAGSWTACAGGVGPSAEVCDGLDNDCDGTADDGDPGGGVVCGTSTGECTAGITRCIGGSLTCFGEVGPSPELCDTLDNDCDGTADDGNPGGGAACGPIGLDGIGICEAGVMTCTGGAVVCVGDVPPTTETCNGLDDDCDGTADDGNPGGGVSCGSGVGECSTGLTDCVSGTLLCVGEVGPTAETCNGLDDDCDGLADDGNPGGGGVCGTGVGECSTGIMNCVSGSLSCTGGVGPVPETCNGLDDDCDGTADNGNPGGGAACGPIGLHGVGICEEGVMTCTGGAVVCVGDVGPLTEVCNNRDDDCDTIVDDGDPGGGGSCGTGVGECTAGTEHCVVGSIVCTGSVGPTAEICDGLDNNCDGVVDDGDPGGGAACGTDEGECTAGTMRCLSGSLTCSGSVGPVPETCNGLDDDCDGSVDEGDPGGGALCGPILLDGIGICEAGVEQCSGGAIVCVGAVDPGTEVCNNLDDDCDGVIDDGDPGGGGSCGTGVGECTAGTEHCIVGSIVCTGSVGPTAEICDGLDNNCDGSIDEGDPGGGASCGSDVGECVSGVVRCVGGTLVCSGETPPTAEMCNGLDDDCDGLIDDGNPEGGAPCGPVTLDGIGICEAGVTTCVTTGPGVASLDCLGAVYPGTEDCNGLDDDCNTLIDDGIATGDPCGTDVGECSPGAENCIAGAWVCVGEVGPVPEICDGLDNNCDGVADEGNPGGGLVCGTDIGLCEPGITYCDTTLTPPAIVCMGEVGPVPEVCNGLDDDCNHLVDDGLPLGDACGTDVGECEEGEWVCLDGELVCSYGRGPEDEVCNGLDDDCDTIADNEAECPGESICVEGYCASPCDPLEEWPCPSGKVCEEVEGYDGTYCVGDPCEDVECGPDERCHGGECVDLCDLITCPPGQVCVIEDGTAICIPADCYAEGYGCDDGERCMGGECVADPCWEVVCPSGEFCREGECHPVCGADIECPEGYVCYDGECVEDPCWGVECTSGRICIDGECVDDPCAGVSCRPPLICVDGECVDDPCSYINCPEGFVCVGGTCVDESTLPEPVPDADTDGGTDEEWERIAATGTGGCAGCTMASGDGGQARWAILLLAGLMGLLAFFRRRRTTPVSKLIVPAVLGLLILSGCNTTPYCLGDCVDAGGDVDPDGEDATDAVTDGLTDVEAVEDPPDPDACNPEADELCNGFDDDCDTLIDEDFDLTSDLNNCGECGNTCDLPHAYPACVDGECIIDPERGCDVNYLDCVEDDPTDPETMGCETYCIRTRDDDSYCDGYDNDCDCEIDEDIDLLTDPDNCGVCGRRCRYPNGIPGCRSDTGLPEDAECYLAGCVTGYHDIDLDPATGCEYECTPCERTLGACETAMTCCTDTGGETCNLLDDDCNGTIDEGDPESGGHCGTDTGECVAGVEHCTSGALTCVGETGPVIEICNGLDDDCDGSDDEPDSGETMLSDEGAMCGLSLGDCELGTTVCIDGTLSCRDDVVPIPEICDGHDNDCNGLIDDGAIAGMGASCGVATGECVQGVMTCVAGIPVCVGEVGPTAEICDTLDNDCDGVVDVGVPGEGTVCGTDTGECVSGTMQCVAGAMSCVGEVSSVTETCDGLDNDCDGTVDDGDPGGGASCGDGTGECVEGVEHCTGGAVTCTGYIGPGTETCDGLDNDCDGTADDGNPGGGAACGTDTGECTAGIVTCTGGRLSCLGEVRGLPETCDTLDNDCDGTVDNGVPGAGVSCGTDTGECVAGTVECVGGSMICDGEVPSTVETCDGLDNDCDGSADEGDPGGGASCGDGTGECIEGVEHCTGGSVTCTGYVGGTAEVCDGLDNDCDGTADEGTLPGIGGSCGTDTGECVAGTILCTGGVPTCTGSTGATTETCNGLDDDCDGTADDSVPGTGTSCGIGTGECVAGTIQCIGASMVCDGEVPPASEVCDGLDNDCDGTADDGDPGGGASCGDGTGECIEGVEHCTGGSVICTGYVGGTAEVCDGLDNNCDGTADEGDPGGGGACGIGTGECVEGVESCVGGGITCTGGSGPVAETCNGLDDDCDGSADEDWVFDWDVDNCGGCGVSCTAGMSSNANVICNMGTCQLISCDANWWDGPAEGCVWGDATCCTYFCVHTGSEICDGVDNDCDTDVDLADSSLVVPPNFCSSLGECAGASPQCSDPCGTGTLDWYCNYSGTVTVSSLDCTTIDPEPGSLSPSCDDLDNDCDGAVDDHLPSKGDVCTRGVGACENTGVNICDPLEISGPLMCSVTAGTGSPEVCNDIDDNCNGSVDEFAYDDWAIIGAVWVDVGSGGMYVLEHEASRPNASSCDLGTELYHPSTGVLTSKACSASGVQPWTDITWDQASLACQNLGGAWDLCTAADWEAICLAGYSGSLDTWSYATAPQNYSGTTCNGNDLDTNCPCVSGCTGCTGSQTCCLVGDPPVPTCVTTTVDEDSILDTGSRSGCRVEWGSNDVYDMSGNVKEWMSDSHASCIDSDGDTTPETTCYDIRGGASNQIAPGLTCQFDFTKAAADFTFYNLGFRCCHP